VSDVAEARLGKMLDRVKNRGELRPYLRNSNVRWFGFDLSDLLRMRFEASELEEFSLRKGDVLVCEGGEPGRAAVWNARREDVYFQKAIHRLRFGALVVPEFFVLAIKASANDGRLRDSFTGSGIQHLTGRSLASHLLPLPPVPEQHLIVAKVGELMALCDQLEAAQKSRAAARQEFAAGTLAGLDGGEVVPSKFAIRHLSTYTTRPTSVASLRASVLRLAVRGKLLSNEGTKDRAARRNPESSSAAEQLNEPFAIPNGWHWARLGSLGHLKGGGTPAKSNPEFWNGEIPWVSPKDMKVDYVSDAKLHISPVALANSAASLVDANSIIFVVRGMILAHSFPVALTRVPLAINQDMKALVLKDQALGEYLLRAMKAMKPEMLARVKRSSHGTGRIEGADYRQFLLPIPPAQERDHIVANVDALMSLCDQLEARLREGDDLRSRLLDSILAEALAPAEAAPA